MKAPKRPARKALKRPARKKTADPAGPARHKDEALSEGAQEVHQLGLNLGQRNALLRHVNVEGPLRRRLESAGSGVQKIEATHAELKHLEKTLLEADLRAAGPDEKRLFVVLGQVVVLLQRGQRRARPKASAKAPPTARSVYQFKIALKDINPPIWRRIQVYDCDLGTLHDYIQGIFGWRNYHLHQFEIEGERYSALPPEEMELDFGEDHLDESSVRLSDFIDNPRRKYRWIYEYDFGDDWRHEIVFEKLVPADPKINYPLCLEGARAGPPEDCGGPWGYPEYCEAIAEPQNERHEELLEWGGPFDPEAFDPAKATKAMRKVK